MNNFSTVKLAFTVYEPSRPSEKKLCPVIFLHGAGDSKENWGSIPKTIAEKSNRMTYALDARNHGDSEWTEHYSFDSNVGDLMHFLDTHSIEKSVLVGHSMGGMTSIKAALKFPNRIEMIFIEDKYVNKVGQKTLNSAMKYFQLCEEAAEHIPPDCEKTELHRHFADYLFEKGSKLKAVGSRESLDKLYFAVKRSDDGRYVWKTNWKALQEAFRNTDSLTSEPQGSYNGPAHFIYGSLSSLRVGEKKEHIRQFFPNAEFFCVEGANHYIHPHHPEQFTEAILNGLLKKQNITTNL